MGKIQEIKLKLRVDVFKDLVYTEKSEKIENFNVYLTCNIHINDCR